MKDDAVTPILATMILMAMMATLTIPLMMAREQAAQALQAEEDRLKAYTEVTKAEAWCIRHPQADNTTLPDGTVYPCPDREESTGNNVGACEALACVYGNATTNRPRVQDPLQNL